MSRKNKTLRSFLHQNQNPTIEQAWDAAWKNAQKKFHARSMQDMEKQVADLQAECEHLRKDAERYRKLRAMHWSESPLAVVDDPKVAVKLGHYCPSGDNLDAVLDEMEESATA